MADELDLPSLRAFSSVAEHGSLTRAATALELAQSVLSRRIAALEAVLGGRLFHRTGRGVIATDLAHLLLPRVRAILAESDALLGAARGEQSSPAGIVELGMVPAVSRPLVGALMERLRVAYPRIRLRALEAYSGQVEEWLAHGRIDIGLFNRYGRGAIKGAEIFLQSDIVLVSARATRRLPASLPFRAVAGIPLALPPRPNSLVTAVTDLAQRHKVAINFALEAGSPALIRDAVKSAGLATLVPQHLAEREYDAASFSWSRIVKPVILQKTWFAFSTQRPTSMAARIVGRLIRDLSTGAVR
jgi:DNA-binding transcriptional LysR family regulator